MSIFSAPVAAGVRLRRIVPSAPVPDAAALRFAGDPLMWIGLPQLTSIRAFATGPVARAEGSERGIPGKAASPWTAFQLSPLPQLNPSAFKKIPGGLPVLLVVVAGNKSAEMPDTTPKRDDVVEVGDAFVAAPAGEGNTAFLAFAFQDRLCRDPLSWAEAVAASDECDASWKQFVADVAASPSTDAGHGPGEHVLRILDHRGAPAAAGAFSIAIGGGAAKSIVLTHEMDGDTGIVLPAAGIATISATGGRHILATGDTDTGKFEAPLTLLPGKRFAQVLPVEQWFAEPTTGVRVKRWNRDSFVEPIQEGNPYFARLVEEMRATKPNGAVELAGWAFVTGSLDDPTVQWPLIPGDCDTTFLKLVKDLDDAGVTVRMLINKFPQFDAKEIIKDFPELLPIVFALIPLLWSLQAGFDIQTDPAGYGVALVAGAALTGALTSPLLADLLEGIIEYSEDCKKALDRINPAIAIWTPYGAAFSDNPLVSSPYTIRTVWVPHEIDSISHVGIYHQKFVNIKKPKTTPFLGADFDYVSYVGGIEINSDRIDTSLHRVQHPFHDVQVRITGPAVADVLRTYEERALEHGAKAAISPDVSLPITGPHLVQIARTYFKPKPGSPTPALSFAPQGENTSLRTMLAAIAQARDFIYIEDQYFTPSDEYVEALLAARDRGVRALMITLPFATDQPYGEVRRRDVLSALKERWKDRLYLGTPLRRYLHATPALTSNLGRMYLAATLEVGATTAYLAPLAHFPTPPYWAFIGNELVLVYGLAGATGASSQEVMLDRASGAPSWGARPVEHPRGAPVMAVQVPGIYVHAKLMVVDDTFLYVGSSNLNRRGLYHDAELNSFTISQHLRGDPANPARILRSRLMAEHLGLTPEMGESLLADPLSALPYFRQRSWYEGSHHQPFTFFGSVAPDVPLGLGSSILAFILNTLFVPSVVKTAQDDVWKLLSDPSTVLDATPGAKGPHYP